MSSEKESEMMRLYFNLAPSRHILKETLMDPQALGYIAIFFVFLHNNVALWSAVHHDIFGICLDTLSLLILGVLILNQIGLATVRHEAVGRGFQRPLPPRYKDVFEKMLAGTGIYIFIAGLLFILLAFTPFNLQQDASTSFLILAQTLLLGTAWYGVTYSKERYTSWYGEIWPDDDGDDGGWDDIFIPDPTPQDHLILD